MNDFVTLVVEQLRGESTVSDRLILDVGLLLERAREGRYEDPVYGVLGFPDEWISARVDGPGIDRVVSALAEVMESGSALAPRAAWAIGKARSDEGARRLVRTLELVWRTNQELAFQILWGLGIHGSETAQRLLSQIEREASGKVREEAARMLAAQRAHAGDR